MKSILTSLFVCASISMNAQFLHQKGTEIVDGSGKPVILRGLGLGGWMLQEGYMLKTADFAGPQYKIREKIQEIIGPEKTEAFYQAYRDNGITKRDIDSLKAWGFNSIRLPMHYKLYTPPIEESKDSWLKEGFDRTDKLLEWCAANQMYLILDMHGTPGGQGKDANISDYDTTKSSLWESQDNRNKLVALWKKLAERYKDSKWIGAYDLINEPNWAFTGTNQNGCDEKSNAPLREIYIELTKAIREVDKNHMIIIEGNCWGNNYSGIFPLWDNNMALSFHKYWNYTNDGSLQTMLDYREKYQVPIWLGESGENSNQWFADAISLVEKHKIGWAWWPMKKIDNLAGFGNVKFTKGYQDLLDYWNGKGPKPDADVAYKSLMEVASNYRIENTKIQYDVIDAMFRQPHDKSAKPFKKHQIGKKVFASDYDFGGHNTAYSDTDFQNLWVDTQKREEWNSGHAYRNDGVDIYSSSDKDSNGYYVGDIKSGEWLRYTIPVKSKTNYSVSLRYSGAAGKVRIEDGKGNVAGTIELKATSGLNDWKTANVKNVKFENPGSVKLVFENDGNQFGWFEVSAK
ncbi:cellulase family glycosylhydrolase [Flavobacterium silvaticum]|uniref:Cellulase family glycosylhydrolase n=1 Tax=Flavobacterium silvaticum TaxID=1852020 RepID=A0A972G351_9FLAO|nr:cellulase family glycosylhydrolase [Flavobacterium silvaticum]NMH29661.1 cellulase family glycosylhydrolase [Flavobacterium silvaticum]